MIELEIAQKLAILAKNSEIAAAMLTNNQIIMEQLLDMITPESGSYPIFRQPPNKQSHLQLTSSENGNEAVPDYSSGKSEDTGVRSKKFTGPHSPIVREFVLTQSTKDKPFNKQDIIDWARQKKKLVLDPDSVTGALGYLGNKARLISSRKHDAGRGFWVRSNNQSPTKKSHFTKESRKRMALAQKKRWANYWKNKSAANAPDNSKVMTAGS